MSYRKHFLGFMLLPFVLAACDVEKQMDTMVDNPSFAEPLFSKFMARPEYQVKAMDTILADPAMRQLMLEKIALSDEYARAMAEQMLTRAELRQLMDQMLDSRQETMPVDSL